MGTVLSLGVPVSVQTAQWFYWNTASKHLYLLAALFIKDKQHST